MSNQLEITGELKHIGEVEIITTTNAEKRIFVIEIEPGQYSQEICFELFRDKVSLINNFQIGDTITVSFNLRGREYQGRWWVNLQAWRLAKSNTPEVEESPLPEEHDDLPF